MSRVEFDVLVRDPEVAKESTLTEAERMYGGPLRFPDAPRPYVFANFVTTIDGVATLEVSGRTDSSVISGRMTEDRFLMAMLRAAADVVLVGVGTLRASPRHQWTPEMLAPGLADQLAEYRADSGRSRDATLVVVSANGDLPEHAALREPAMPVCVITTQSGADRAAATAPSARVIVAADAGAIRGSTLLEVLERETAAARVLCEGGPTLFGSLLRDGAAHELFLTVSPRVAGRDDDRRLGLAQGWSAGPDALLAAGLRSVRRSGDHLFLRYRLGG